MIIKEAIGWRGVTVLSLSANATILSAGLDGDDTLSVWIDEPDLTARERETPVVTLFTGDDAPTQEHGLGPVYCFLGTVGTPDRRLITHVYAPRSRLPWAAP